MIRLSILGVPKPGGSKRAFSNKQTGRAQITDACKGNTDWRNAVVIQARTQHDGPTLDEPVRVEVSFFMPRIKSHFGTGKNAGRLKDNAPLFHSVKPDVLKLMRSTEDALTDAGIWQDDALVSEQVLRKYYASGRPPGAEISIETIAAAMARETTEG